MANLIQVLCKIDGKLEHEKRLGYFDEGWLSDEEIIELNPDDYVYDLNLKVEMRVSDTESYALAVARCSAEDWTIAEPLHKWLKSKTTEAVA